MKKEEYYLNLIDKLSIAVETKELGESLTIDFYRLIDMLSDDVLDIEQKHKISILAENALSNVRDFPEKLSGQTRK